MTDDKTLGFQSDSWVMSYPKWHFNVLTAPYFHFFIIAANMVEIFFRDGEETTSKRGSPIEKFCESFLMISPKKQKKKELNKRIVYEGWYSIIMHYLIGYVSSFLLCFSWLGRLSQPKARLQSKLPRLWFWPYGDGFMNSKVLRSIVVISGLATAV